MIDTISRADAIEAKPEYRNEDMLDKEKSTYNKGWNDCNDAWAAIIKALPSAEAEQVTGKLKNPCDSLLTGDSDECKEQKSKLESAEAEWIPFTKRPLTDEEKQEYPDWTYIFDCPLPDDEEEILLSNGKYVWTDTFINDGECYLDGGDDIDDGMAWMPLPEPYKGGEK